MKSDDVLVIGAGPFGLSISAHLRDREIGHRVVGRPMDTWRAHMPPGMLLRSEPYGSDMAAPTGSWDLEAHARQFGLDYKARLGPLSGERFLEYADWYQSNLVPEVSDAMVADIVPTDHGFRVEFADDQSCTVRKVVVATGVLPYRTMPDEVAGLPSDLVSHTGDHHRLDPFGGRTVAVVGGGQSALETAALLHEAGARVVVVARRSAINWLEPNPEHIGPLGWVRRPVNKLCEGWHCAFWNTPSAFRRLPADVRTRKARSVLGPAGAWWLKDRMQGVVEVRTGQRLRAVTASGSGVRLDLDGAAGQSTLEVDHVMCGTGFRVDVRKLTFLGRPVLSRIETLDGFPVVTRGGESTVPGLYFAGAPAAASLGPSTRFIAGTHTSVRPMVGALARALGASGTASRVPSPTRTSAASAPVYGRT